MKRVMALGPIAVVAVFAMALLGPSIAMGESTSLCEVDESPCGSPISHVHYISKDMRITVPEMNYQCDVLFLGDVSALGSPQTIEGTFTYTNCNQKCSRKEENGPAVLDLLRTGTEAGELTGEAEIHSFCLGFIDCVYSFENLVGKANGPLISNQENGEFRYNEVPLTHVSGFLCPKEAYLDATFVPLSATYISS